MIKKIVLLIFVFNILLTNFHIVYSQEVLEVQSLPIDPTELKVTTVEENSEYPSGEKFKKLESLVEEYLVGLNNWKGKYGWNIKYNEIIEREIKLIVMETYEGNEEFYTNLFRGDSYYYGDQDDSELEKILSSIPKSDVEYKVSRILFNNNFITDDLLEASFGLWYESSNYDSFLYSLQRIIEMYKNQNGYYPSIEELGKERIYKDLKEQAVADVMEDIDYNMEYSGKTFKAWEEKVTISELLEAANFIDDDLKLEIWEDIENIRSGLWDAHKLRIKYEEYVKNNQNKAEPIDVYIDMYAYIKDKYFQNSTYTLAYKDINYSYEQALKKNKDIEELKWIAEPVYKDYKKLIGDTEVKDIPEIYKKIPSDSMFFHVSNPEFMFQLLESKNTLVNSSSGLQILKKLKDLSMVWFDIEDWNTIKDNLKHEFIVVMSDIDLSSPSIVVIIHKEDKGVLVPGKKPKVAVTIWDYIYIASSEKALDNLTSLKEEKSVYQADDFRYVWMKKQAKKKDMFFFVWDKFFENLILMYSFHIKLGVNEIFNYTK